MPRAQAGNESMEGLIMNRKSLCTVIGLVTMALAARAAFAQIAFSAGPPGPPPPIAMMLAGLSLTSEQQTAIAALIKSHQQMIAPLMDQLHTEHQQLTATLLSSGQVSLSDLTPLEQQSAATQQQLQQEMLKAALDVRAVLTPDQLAAAAANQKKLDQLHSEMRLIMEPPSGSPGAM
jgi:Spy/CpxP family protein refolding chaperone